VPSQIRIGCSGWEYRHWRGSFYPGDLPQSRWLEHYASRFDTVELNGTFYRLPEAKTFDRWRERAPDGFRYAVKASRYLTHQRRRLGPSCTSASTVEAARTPAPTRPRPSAPGRGASSNGPEPGFPPGSTSTTTSAVTRPATPRACARQSSAVSLVEMGRDGWVYSARSARHHRADRVLPG